MIHHRKLLECFASLNICFSPYFLSGNIFVVSLSAANIVVALYWLDAGCSAVGLGVIGSVFNITAIAINRYCYICYTMNTTTHVATLVCM